MARSTTSATVAITSIALFIVGVGNLAVLNVLSELGRDVDDATAAGLEWSLVAYPLAFAVVLLTAAALGDRYGRRLTFMVGLAIFSVASAGGALANSIEVLDIARAVQGIGGATAVAAALGILGYAIPRHRARLAFSVWAGVGALGAALGPTVGAAIADVASWEWIFWVSAAVGIATIALAFAFVHESQGPDTHVDLFGLVFSALGVFGLAWGLIRGPDEGWTSNEVLLGLGGGVFFLAAFVARELRTYRPMLALRLFRDRRFAATSAASVLMYFGLFGWLLLIVQFFEVVQGYSPLKAGLAVLPATAIPIVIAPFARVLLEEIGDLPWVVVGLALQTIGLGWIAYVMSPGIDYVDLLTPMAIFGVGVGLFFVAVASLVVGSAPQEAGAHALSAQTALQALGGGFGIAALVAILASYDANEASDALVDAMWITTAVVAGGTIVSLLLPRMRRKRVPEVVPTVVETPARGASLLSSNGPEAGSVLQQPDVEMEMETEADLEGDAYPCPVCMGHGWFPFEPPQDPRTAMCQRCMGHGKVLTGSHVVGHTVRDCPECQGLGFVEVRAAYEPMSVTRGAPTQNPAS